MEEGGQSHISINHFELVDLLQNDQRKYAKRVKSYLDPTIWDIYYTIGQCPPTGLIDRFRVLQRSLDKAESQEQDHEKWYTTVDLPKVFLASFLVPYFHLQNDIAKTKTRHFTEIMGSISDLQSNLRIEDSGNVSYRDIASAFRISIGLIRKADRYFYRESKMQRADIERCEGALFYIATHLDDLALHNQELSHIEDSKSYRSVFEVESFIKERR